MTRPIPLLRSLLVTLALLGAVPACGGGNSPTATPSPTPFPDPTPAARFASWRGAELGAFTFDHAILEDGAARIAPAGGLDGQDTTGLYGGEAFTYGTLLSREIPVTTPFREAIVSWESTTPPGTWVEVKLATRNGLEWTKEYNLGIWSSGGEAFARHSVEGQGDADGTVFTDTLALVADADAFQIRATLFAAPGAQTPRLRALAVVTSSDTAPIPALAADPSAHGIAIDVPMRSQMIYAGGGEVWCSPTSTSMIVAHWAAELGDPSLALAVPETASATYDAVYEGTGNWSFNTAWAASRGDAGVLRAFVTRLWRIEQLERLTKAGFPVVVSGSWSAGGMTGSPLTSTAGHVFVVRGFDASGDVLVNEPAAATDAAVRHTYDRAEFDAAWSNSGRTVFVIHPADRALPADGALGSW